MTTTCNQPLPFDALVDYLAGDLGADDASRIEEHFFACAACTSRLEAVERIAAGVAEAVRTGAAAMPVTGDIVTRIAADGLTLRQYEIDPGAHVLCTVAPDDDLVVVRLRGDFGDVGGATVEVDTADLDAGDDPRRSTIVATVDRDHDEIILMFRGDDVRAYPRSLWTMHVRIRPTDADDDETAGPRLGPYIMDHTPWDRLDSPR